MYERLSKWISTRDKKIDNLATQINQTNADRIRQRGTGKGVVPYDSITRIDLLRMMGTSSS